MANLVYLGDTLLGPDITGKADKIPVVEHDATETSAEISPDAVHVWPEMAELSVTLGSAPSDGNAHVWCLRFTSGATPTTLSLPAAIKWDVAPSPAENTVYEISIMDGLGTVKGFAQ